MAGRTVPVLGGGIGGLAAANELRRRLAPVVRSPRNPITRSGVSDHLTGGRGAADVGGLLTP